MSILARFLVAAGLLLAVVGCSGDTELPSGVEVMATGLEVPWGLEFLPDGDALVGERETGRLYRIPADGGERELVATVPGVVPGGEGGLLGIALDPLFAHSNHSFVYAYLTAATDNRIVRFNLDPSGAGSSGGIYNLQVLVTGIAKAGNHDGGGLAFGPDGMLYAGTGDAGVPDRAQDPASLNGKILRMDILGKPPVIDPNPDPDSLVWSMGHRNVQGLAWDRAGHLFATEFGQDTWDEVNRIEPGKNYGWPAVEGTSDDPEDAAYTNPELTWKPEEASPSGAAIVDQVLYVGALRGERLWSAELRGGHVVGPADEHLKGEFGRLRNVQRAPDGSLWVTTSNWDGRGDPVKDDDRVLRLADPDSTA